MHIPFNHQEKKMSTATATKASDNKTESTSKKDSASKKGEKVSNKKASTKKGKTTHKADVVEATIEVVDGSWQDTIVKSNKMLARGTAATSKAGTMLWTGAVEGITDWLGNRADTDPEGEEFYGELVGLLGKPRRGDANKIKKVALAAKNKGLVLSEQQSLSKAYKEANRLLEVDVQNEADDHAADALFENYEAPATTKTPEGAAKILLKGGVDEATRLVVSEIIDTAGGDYDKASPVLRAFLRSFSQEMAGRKPKPEPKVKAPVETKKSEAKAKAKPGVKSKAKPVPNPKADRDEASGAEPVDEDSLVEVDGEGVEVLDDLDGGEDVVSADSTDEVSEDVTPEVPVKAQPTKAKAKPIIRRN